MDRLREISKRIQNCNCGNAHYEITMEKVVVDYDALQHAVLFLKEKTYGHVVLVADETTFNVAGKALLTKLIDNKFGTTVSLIQPDEQGDVVANEESIVQLLLEVPQDADVLLAVGAGTIHDISRIVSYKMQKPFISIPTAASVDGFNSMGAPLVIRGKKITYQSLAPIAVFADLHIITDAPKQMTAAGLGDMLGKSTSLADWRFGSLVGKEPFCPLAFEITQQALQSCMDNIDLISEGNAEGVKLLMEALINSGIAMLIVGNSYPASGGEHHVSHYWEMDFLEKKKRQVLHGAKVSISCYIIADLYKNEIKNSILVNQKNQELVKNKQKIVEILESIPEAKTLKEMVKKVGGETEPNNLGISRELVVKSLREAHSIRDRFTLLNYYNKFLK